MLLFFFINKHCDRASIYDKHLINGPHLSSPLIFIFPELLATALIILLQKNPRPKYPCVRFWKNSSSRHPPGVPPLDPTVGVQRRNPGMCPLLCFVSVIRALLISIVSFSGVGYSFWVCEWYILSAFFYKMHGLNPTNWTNFLLFWPGVVYLHSCVHPFDCAYESCFYHCVSCIGLFLAFLFSNHGYKYVICV